MVKPKLKLTDTRNSFKPFSYPWAYEMWEKHEQIHWLHSVVMQQDIRDWKTRLTEPQKNFLIQIFRLFTQSDVDVAGSYVNNYLPIFPQPEIRMMLLGFAAREAVHIAAYSHLMETLGFPDSVYDELKKWPPNTNSLNKLRAPIIRISFNKCAQLARLPKASNFLVHL